MADTLIAPDKIISDEIKLQLADATSPEAQLTYKVPQRANGTSAPGTNLNDTVKTFELRTGPTDVTAYHDFYKLQIAFEHIWTEVLDKQIGIQAQALYEEWVNRKMSQNLPAPNPSISSVAELRQFMDDIRAQSLLPAGSGDRNLVGSQVSDGKGGTISVGGSGGSANMAFPATSELGGGAALTGPIRSPNGQIQLVLAQGALLLWGPDTTPLWGGPGGGATRVLDTGGRAVQQAAMQDDGSFVLILGDNSPFVVNLGAAHPGAVLRVQDDGNLVIYDGSTNTNIWATGTNVYPPPAVPQTAQAAPATGAAALESLLSGLDSLLAEQQYAFQVFAEGSINFGVLLNYRQAWTPKDYQVGDLVSTVPLAPQEVRRYTTKTVVKKTRNVKEIDDALRVRKTETSETSRVDAEIVQKALTKTNFQITASESFGGDQTFKVSAGQAANTEQSKESAQTKKEFHESVVKSAQEYRDQHRTEVSTSEVSENETTTFHEIRNPNDELTVTYLFYELQRTYDVSEKLHRITPVVLVANAVPAPHEITETWLITHDWILRRAILDDSFLPALDYLSKSFVGAEVALQVLGINMQQQKDLVDRIGQQVLAKNRALDAAQKALDDAVAAKATKQGIVGAGSFIKSFFDPLNLTQSGKTDDTADQTMIDAAKDALDRVQVSARDLLSQLTIEVTALQLATNKFSAAVQEHFNRLTEVDRLRIHVKDNILHYMQAIWSAEQPDQRYFRIYKQQVPIFHHNTTVDVLQKKSILPQQPQKYEVAFPVPALDYEVKELNEVADLDNLLGFKGNYMIFPLVEYDYLTYYMMQDYVDVGAIVRAKDPHEFGNFSLDQLEDYMRNLYEQSPERFRAQEEEFKSLIVDYLSSKPSDDLVIVPTKSLYIEALPGTYPLLEDFKLIHRALDVKKVQAEVRHAELENARLASRILKGNDEDPDIDKKIVVEGTDDVIVGP
jgi:hypothetical protein